MARLTADDDIQQVGREILLAENERNNLEGEVNCDIFEVVPIYRSTVAHAEQQTYESALQLAKENAALKEQITHLTCGVKMIKENDERTSFYTGLPSWNVFREIFDFLSPHVTPSHSLPLEDEFVMILMRLRLGLLLEDLSARFGVTASFVSRSFQKWLEVMYHRLQFLIKWPLREVIKENMPPAFKQLYPNCICIIDCSEIFIDTPKKYEARSVTYSNYKKHNTVKFLIGITPCGSISFLSKCWGGRVSDKVLTQESGFLHLIEPGDVILADRGFTTADDLAVYGAKLELPAFTRGKTQLSQRDVEYSKQLSTVRIHVERVIGHLKSKYRILKGPLSITLLKHRTDTSVAKHR